MAIPEGFDYGTDYCIEDYWNTGTQYATNRQLAERQLRLIRPFLKRTDEGHLRCLVGLLADGLGRRKV